VRDTARFFKGFSSPVLNHDTSLNSYYQNLDSVQPLQSKIPPKRLRIPSFRTDTTPKMSIFKTTFRVFENAMASPLGKALFDTVAAVTAVLYSQKMKENSQLRTEKKGSERARELRRREGCVCLTATLPVAQSSLHASTCRYTSLTFRNAGKKRVYAAFTQIASIPSVERMKLLTSSCKILR
jgi:hypothetical protein